MCAKHPVESAEKEVKSADKRRSGMGWDGAGVVDRYMYVKHEQ